ncbi:MAG TPA: hypothetical protein VF070_18920 [Streptosporangiaceae bacterium]
MSANTPCDRLDTLITQQFGVVSRTQLLAHGMTERTLQYRIRPGGPWQKMLPGIYLTQTGPHSLLQREEAALLYAGNQSVITGPAAMFHYSLRAPSLDLIHVLVPADRRRRSVSFVQVQRTFRMPLQVSTRGPLQFALVPRAVMDTARATNDRSTVRAVIADAIQLGRCSLRQLAAELDDGPVRHSALARSVLAEVGQGIRSTAEGDLLDLLKESGLPMPLLNPDLYMGDEFIARPDAWWPDAGVAVEVDSREWHISPAAWEKTMARHSLMFSLGIYPLHFSPRQLRQESAAVIKRIRDTYQRGLERGPLPIRTVSRGSGL